MLSDKAKLIKAIYERDFEAAERIVDDLSMRRTSWFQAKIAAKRVVRPDPPLPQIEQSTLAKAA